MTAIREELVSAALNRSQALIDINTYNSLDKQHEFEKKTILTDKSLTEDEKLYAMERLTKIYDENRDAWNEGTKRICENCHKECLAISYCEHCVRNYLEANFSNWTSGNDSIDDLIQK